jgi:2-methylisocitrate lyase-like PEP mutase family enzyme
MTDLAARPDLSAHFRALHNTGSPLLMPNPWDAGSARVLQSLGFQALATTSGGFALTLGRRDGQVSRDEAISHGAAVVAAVDVPVSADLENGFGDTPEDVAETVRAAVSAGLAGCSIEDYTRDGAAPVYDLGAARERVTAAVEAAGGRLVLTARCENFLYGRDDLDDTVRRLQAYAEAGADVVYAPGVREAGQIKAIVSSVDVPVNVLLLPGVPAVPELAELGVHRISIGGTFATVAMGALAEAAREFQAGGTGFFAAAATGSQALKAALA